MAVSGRGREREGAQRLPVTVNVLFLGLGAMCTDVHFTFHANRHIALYIYDTLQNTEVF